MNTSLGNQSCREGGGGAFFRLSMPGISQAEPRTIDSKASPSERRGQPPSPGKSAQLAAFCSPSEDGHTRKAVSGALSLCARAAGGRRRRRRGERGGNAREISLSLFRSLSLLRLTSTLAPFLPPGLCARRARCLASPWLPGVEWGGPGGGGSGSPASFRLSQINAPGHSLSDVARREML